MNDEKKILAILVGGGPAPGINGVIGSAALEAMGNGLRVIGIYDGFRWLAKGDSSQVVELTRETVSRIHLQGGSILRTSRTNPAESEETMANAVDTLKKLNVSYLITIGGDDPASSSRRIAERLAGTIQVVHVPKTIDNDLPLKEGQPTFGYQTARELGYQLLQNLLEDSKTTGRWYVVVAMGRSAGHLALGMAKSAGAHLCVIPEELDKNQSFDTVVDLIEAAMLKRQAMGRPDGVVVIAEGVALKLDPEVWERPEYEGLAKIKEDDFGHLRLAEVEFAVILKRGIEKRFSDRGEKVTTVASTIGYELRCAPPTAFDSEYTRKLGCGAVQYLLGQLPGYEVKPGCMMGVEDDELVVLDLDTLKDDTGHTQVRLVNMDGDHYRTALRYQMRLTKADLDSDVSCAKLAEAGKVSMDEVRQKFGYLAM